MRTQRKSFQILTNISKYKGKIHSLLKLNLLIYFVSKIYAYHTVAVDNKSCAMSILQYKDTNIQFSIQRHFHVCLKDHRVTKMSLKNVHIWYLSWPLQWFVMQCCKIYYLITCPCALSAKDLIIPDFRSFLKLAKQLMILQCLDRLLCKLLIYCFVRCHKYEVSRLRDKTRGHFCFCFKFEFQE